MCLPACRSKKSSGWKCSTATSGCRWPKRSPRPATRPMADWNSPATWRVFTVGAGMTAGRIDVAGNAGRHMGSQMTGGEIHVAGSAAIGSGPKCTAARFMFAAMPATWSASPIAAAPRGMTGGTIVVAGGVGDECGHTMRRGLIAVGGSCGDFAGINMIAGSVVVFGDCGVRAGAAMRRGTIALFGPRSTAAVAHVPPCLSPAADCAGAAADRNSPAGAAGRRGAI